MADSTANGHRDVDVVEHRPPVGDFAGHFALRFIEVVDFGIRLDEVLTGTEIPPGGTRIDVHVAGSITGGPLEGELTGTDHLDFQPGLRSVGRHIHLTLTTTTGARVAAAGECTVTQRPGVDTTELRVAVLLRSTATDTASLDGSTIWAVGAVDPFAGKIEGDLFFAY